MSDKLDALLDSIPIPSHKKREIKKLFEEETKPKRKPRAKKCESGELS